MGPLKSIVPSVNSWSDRWWGVIQAALLALVGYMTLQVINTQSMLAAVSVEIKYSNQRLEKIEKQLDATSTMFYSKEEAAKDREQLNKILINFDARLTDQNDALKDIRARLDKK